MNHNKIAALRKSWALTQEELAYLLGTTRSNLSRLELAAKSYTLETAFILQALFGVSVSAIFPNDERIAHELLVPRLAEFSLRVEEDGDEAERKRQLLSEFASRVPHDLAAA